MSVFLQLSVFSKYLRWLLKPIWRLQICTIRTLKNACRNSFKDSLYCAEKTKSCHKSLTTKISPGFLLIPSSLNQMKCMKNNFILKLSFINKLIWQILILCVLYKKYKKTYLTNFYCQIIIVEKSFREAEYIVKTQVPKYCKDINKLLWKTLRKLFSCGIYFSVPNVTVVVIYSMLFQVTVNILLIRLTTIK